MQHLNIPFSRHTKTTQPLGRVVWLMLFVLCIATVFVFQLESWWLNRGNIFFLAPSDTIFAIEFHLNQTTEPFLSEWLAGIPLITDIELELKDLSPYIHGNFAIFINKNAQRSLAIRASIEDLPDDFLSNSLLSIQEQNGFLLLSSTLLPINGISASLDYLFIPLFGKTWLGRVVFPDIGSSGTLYLSDKEMTLNYKTNNEEPLEYPTIESTSLSLSGLSWGDETINLEGLHRLIKDSLFLQNKVNINIVVREGDQLLETLIAINDIDANSTIITKELQKIGAFAKPTLISQALPDGTILQEILVQPEFVSVEEISTNLGLYYRVQTSGGESIFSMIQEGSVLFSNSEKLLEDYAKAPKNTSSDCQILTNWLDPEFLLLQTQSDSLSTNHSIAKQIIRPFSAISFETNKYSNKIHFCRR